jgi:hypothetical protein
MLKLDLIIALSHASMVVSEIMGKGPTMYVEQLGIHSGMF